MGRDRVRASALLAALLLATWGVVAGGACSSFGASAASPDGGDGDAATCDAAAASMTDPKNCGACDHDCLGGACDGGVCQPVAVATSGDPGVLDLVVDQDHVVWTTSTGPDGQAGAVYVCPKSDGCASPPQSLTGPNAPIGGLSSNGTTAYLSQLFGAAQVDRFDDGALTELATAFAGLGTGQFAYLHSRPTGLYVESFNDPTGPSGHDRTIYFFDGATVSTVGVPFEGDDGGMMLNATEMAVTLRYAYLGIIDAPSIMRLSLAGGAWTTAVSDPLATVHSMTSTDDHVIWTDATNDVRACGEGDTCDATTLVTHDALGGKALTVVVAAGDLLIETDTGKLWTCTPSSCGDSLRLVAEEPSLALAWSGFGHTAFADEGAIYWAALDPDGAGGERARIMKVAKAAKVAK